MRLKMSSGKQQPFCLGLNVLIWWGYPSWWWMPGIIWEKWNLLRKENWCFVVEQEPGAGRPIKTFIYMIVVFWHNCRINYAKLFLVISHNTYGDCFVFMLICLNLVNQSQGDASQYGPVAIIVTASGHQVRCIPWVQMGTFNKQIGFLCGLKFFALNIFCGKYLQSSLHLMLQIWWKALLWKMCQ